jgi:hypothetical protein
MVTPETGCFVTASTILPLMLPRNSAAFIDIAAANIQTQYKNLYTCIDQFSLNGEKSKCKITNKKYAKI